MVLGENVGDDSQEVTGAGKRLSVAHFEFKAGYQRFVRCYLEG